MSALLACGGPGGGRGPSLEQVRKESVALRSRSMLALESSVVFPSCDDRPSPRYFCGLSATREAEQAISASCGADAECRHQRYSALWSQIAARAEQLGVELDAVVLRCGDACRDLRELELEVLRTAARRQIAETSSGLLRADAAEYEAIVREHEKEATFLREKNERSTALATLEQAQQRSVHRVARDGLSLPHETLCIEDQSHCASGSCRRLPQARLGLCEAQDDAAPQ